MTSETQPAHTVDTATGDAADVSIGALEFKYPGVDSPTLRDIDLNLSPASITALVGPSGCGKTTLLKLIGGILTPTGGRLLVNGEDQSQLALKHRRIGWVPQQYALFEHLDVKGNIAFGLRAQKRPKAERAERVQQMLQLCQIADLADRPVTDLSGGQRQRVAIARALAPFPKVLLLDEPLAALDPQLRGKLRADLAEMIRAAGVTTIIVTHDQDEALAVADHLVVMRAGEVVTAGPPAEVWSHPEEAWTAEFLGGATVLPILVRPEQGLATVVPGLDVPVRGSESADSLALQPADFSARTPDASGASSGHVEATVEHCEFTGDNYRLRLALPDGLQLPATSPTLCQVGERVLVSATHHRIVPEVTA